MDFSDVDSASSDVGSEVSEVETADTDFGDGDGVNDFDETYNEMNSGEETLEYSGESNEMDSSDFDENKSSETTDEMVDSELSDFDDTSSTNEVSESPETMTSDEPMNQSDMTTDESVDSALYDFEDDSDIPEETPMGESEATDAVEESDSDYDATNDETNYDTSDINEEASVDETEGNGTENAEDLSNMESNEGYETDDLQDETDDAEMDATEVADKNNETSDGAEENTEIYPEETDEADEYNEQDADETAEEIDGSNSDLSDGEDSGDVTEGDENTSDNVTEGSEESVGESEIESGTGEDVDNGEGITEGDDAEQPVDDTSETEIDGTEDTVSDETAEGENAAEDTVDDETAEAEDTAADDVADDTEEPVDETSESETDGTEDTVDDETTKEDTAADDVADDTEEPVEDTSEAETDGTEDAVDDETTEEDTAAEDVADGAEEPVEDTSEAETDGTEDAVDDETTEEDTAAEDVADGAEEPVEDTSETETDGTEDAVDDETTEEDTATEDVADDAEEPVEDTSEAETDSAEDSAKESVDDTSETETDGSDDTEDAVNGDTGENAEGVVDDDTSENRGDSADDSSDNVREENQYNESMATENGSIQNEKVENTPPDADNPNQIDNESDAKDSTDQGDNSEKTAIFENVSYHQGQNDLGALGTCGPTSIANSLNRVTGTSDYSENAVLHNAMDNNLCHKSDNPYSCGGTTTKDVVNIIDNVKDPESNIHSEVYEYGNALDVDTLADRLDDSGTVAMVGVDSATLWDRRGDVSNSGLFQGASEAPSDHWITVDSPVRDENGNVIGFNVIDSGGGVDFVDRDKFERMYQGDDNHRVSDPTAILVSNKGEAVYSNYQPEGVERASNYKGSGSELLSDGGDPPQETSSYDDFKSMTSDEQIEKFSAMPSEEIYDMVKNSPESWPIDNYDKITPENAKDFIVLNVNEKGEISFNLDWPKYGGYDPKTISPISQLDGKVDVSRDGGDGGYTMGIGKNPDGTYPGNSERSIPKSSSEVNTGTFDVDRYKDAVDIVSSDLSDDEKTSRLMEMGFDEDSSDNMLRDYENWKSRPEIIGDNNIEQGAKMANSEIDMKYGVYGKAAEWDVGDVHMKGGAGQMNTVFSWGTCRDSGIITNCGKSKIA